MKEKFEIRLKTNKENIKSNMEEHGDYYVLGNPYVKYSLAYPKTLWEKVPSERDVTDEITVENRRVVNFKGEKIFFAMNRHVRFEHGPCGLRVILENE